MSKIIKSAKRNPLQAIALGITILITLGNILGLYFILTITNTLAPLEKNISVMAEEMSGVKSQISILQDQHTTFVTKDTLSQIVTRLDHISARLDAVYNIVASRN